MLLQLPRDSGLGTRRQIFSRRQFPTLSPDTTDENRAVHLSYGLGWSLHDEGWRNYTVYFSKARIGIVIMTNSSNGEGVFKALLESLLKNTFTPIEWEGFTPYEQLSPRRPPA